MLNSVDALEEEERELRFDVRASRESAREHYLQKMRNIRNRRVGTACLTTSLVVGTGIGLLALRLIVLMVESYTLISSERMAEDEFVELCASGTARESAHMRQACMRANVDRSSPIVIGALTRGTYAFMRELYVFLGWPFQTIGVVGIVSMLGVLPWIESIRVLLFGATRTPTPTAPEHTIVVLNSGDRMAGLSHPQLRMSSGGHKSVATPPIIEEDGFQEISLSGGRSSSMFGGHLKCKTL